MMSRVVTGLLSRLDDPTIPARSAAQALGALAPILKLLYGWDREPELQRMERAKTSYADLLEEAPNNAVNLALVNTTPEQLRAIADEQLAKENRDGQRDPSAKECNGQCGGPPPVAPEQSRAAWGGRPSPEKEAPPLPVKQPVQPRRETPPPLLSPQERRKQELEELDRLRAEWRGRR